MTKITKVLALSAIFLSPLALAAPSIHVDTLDMEANYSLDHLFVASGVQTIQKTDTNSGLNTGAFADYYDQHYFSNGHYMEDYSMTSSVSNSNGVFSMRSSIGGFYNAHDDNEDLSRSSFGTRHRSSSASLNMNFSVGYENANLNYSLYSELGNDYEIIFHLTNLTTGDVFNGGSFGGRFDPGTPRGSFSRQGDITLFAGHSYQLFTYASDRNESEDDYVGMQFDFGNAAMSVPAPAGFPLLFIALMSLFGLRNRRGSVNK